MAINHTCKWAARSLLWPGCQPNSLACMLQSRFFCLMTLRHTQGIASFGLPKFGGELALEKKAERRKGLSGLPIGPVLLAAAALALGAALVHRFFRRDKKQQEQKHQQKADFDRYLEPLGLRSSHSDNGPLAGVQVTISDL